MTDHLFASTYRTWTEIPNCSTFGSMVTIFVVCVRRVANVPLLFCSREEEGLVPLSLRDDSRLRLLGLSQTRHSLRNDMTHNETADQALSFRE